jgi:adenylate cyclase
MRATPLAAPVAGVEIHAAIIDNILTGDFLREPTWMWALDLTAVILVCLVLTLATCKGRSWLSFLVALAAIAGALGASQWIFTHMQLVLTPVHMVLAVTLTYPTLTTISFWQHERHERWIRENFGAMVSDKVLTYLESTPRDVVLAGRKTEATILFTDIAGFSGIAEQLEPDALSDLLNRYLSPMTEIIMRHDGYVDKYVGDMIMADWGVPHRVENHAREACLAALEMVTHLKTLRTQLHAEFGHELYARIGINSGTVTAGNMGSDRRFQYSVMGDAVNLAARLEPLNKAYGTQVIVGESTANAVREPFIFRHLDRATVAGKSHAAEVFELVGKRGEVSEKVIEMVATYEIALQARWRGDLEQAQALLNQALTLVPGDPPSIKMLDLIRWEMTSGKGATRPGPLALAS